ncbi:Nucleoside ABC transporter, ATP-binding protein [Olavius algarvensis associated proteobacterium Delta 3]|nr:Nucleoside ABC transporter, ATP-binding protein [Olavius algarvensis associated proteobacterium Delta 3]
MTPSSPLIRLESIRKTYGPVVANDNISLDFSAGKITALLGENGAGKSTLMSILAGRTQPDSGRIMIDGELQKKFSTQAAINAGIGMVYQHFQLVEAMTVAENIYLGRHDRFWLSPKRMIREATELGQRFGLQIDPSARVDSLSMGEKQRVEILKLLQRECRILIFDEPTAVLTPQEGEQLFEAMKFMAAQEKAVVFISHKLSEVMAVADDIAILRKGAIVDDIAASEVTSEADLARRMVGRDVLLHVDRTPLEPKQVFLETDGLGDAVLKDIRITLRQGEILGIVGVAGNGQKQLVETICGLRPPETGRVRILGLEWNDFFRNMPWDAALSYIPEDRQGLATCLGLDLVDNVLLTTRQGFTTGPWLNRGKAEQKTRELVGQFSIRTPGTGTTAARLSGGNLQKMVLAREFYRRPRVIVAEQPTQGLDIGAMEEVWTILLKARERAGILLVTGDLKEAITLCDRIAVMFEGRIVDEFSTEDSEKLAQIGLMMAGVPSGRDGLSSLS